MTKCIKTFFILLLMTLVFTKVSEAIMDVPEKVLMVVSKVEEQVSIVDKNISSIEEAKRQVMTGVMNTKTFQLYDKINKATNERREYQPATVISSVSGLLKDPDIEEITKKVKEEYVPEYGKGNDSILVKENNLKRTMVQQSNTSALYAKALVTKYLLQIEKQKNKSAPDISQENTIEVVQANRAISNQIALRLVDILAMEAAMLELEGTHYLGSMKLEIADPSENGGG